MECSDTETTYEPKEFDLSDKYREALIWKQYDLYWRFLLDDCNENNLVLCWACFNGYLAEVKYMVEELHFDVNDTNGLCLTIAGSQGHLEVVKYLVGVGCNIHSGKYSGGDPLYYTSCHGHLEVIKYLFDCGAAESIKENLPLIGASKHGHLSTVEYLLNYCDVNGYYEAPLIRACYNNHLEVVKLLLERGANIHAKDDLALTSATKNGHTAIVEYLGLWTKLMDVRKRVVKLSSVLKIQHAFCYNRICLF